MNPGTDHNSTVNSTDPVRAYIKELMEPTDPDLSQIDQILDNPTLYEPFIINQYTTILNSRKTNRNNGNRAPITGNRR